MTMDTLKVFCDIVRLKSFSRGAEENDLTQSAVSQTIHHLEEKLGVTLIDRSQRPWKLTQEGRLFYDGCRELTERYFDLQSRVKKMNQEAQTVVHIASIYSAGLRHMRQIAENFSKKYPHARVQLEYHHPDEIYVVVGTGEVDLGIVSFPQLKRGLVWIPWKIEPMVAACHPQHPLTKARRARPEHLMGEKLVGFEKNLAIRREIDRFMKRHEIHMDVVLEFDNIEAIKRAVEIGSGISILPRPTLDRELETGTLAAVELWTDELVRPLGILYRRGQKLGANVQRFIDLMKEGAAQ